MNGGSSVIPDGIFTTPQATNSAEGSSTSTSAPYQPSTLYQSTDSDAISMTANFDTAHIVSLHLVDPGAAARHVANLWNRSERTRALAILLALYWGGTEDRVAGVSIMARLQRDAPEAADDLLVSLTSIPPDYLDREWIQSQRPAIPPSLATLREFIAFGKCII